MACCITYFQPSCPVGAGHCLGGDIGTGSSGAPPCLPPWPVVQSQPGMSLELGRVQGFELFRFGGSASPAGWRAMNSGRQPLNYAFIRGLPGLSQALSPEITGTALPAKGSC